MLLKTFLIIFCTIAVLFIELNNGAPTKTDTTKKPTSTVKPKIATQTK